MNSNKINKVSKFVNITISLVLAIFLILLTNRIISDIGNWNVAPNYPNAESVSTELITKQNILRDSLFTLHEEKSRFKKLIQKTAEDYKAEKESFETWVAARKSIGLASEDTAIRKRANALDELHKVKKSWEQEVDKVQTQINAINNENNLINDKIKAEKQLAFEVYEEEMHSFNLRIFMIRFGIMIPILLLGVFFFFKFRNHKYWPIFLGYIIFSVYSFFVGVVPYFPAYGGYVRYTIGILLCIVVGKYSIDWLKNYIARRKEEIEKAAKSPKKDRFKNVDLAEKALKNHNCPSCGKDFLNLKWTNQSESKVNTDGTATDFCRYCGTQLFAPCQKCDHVNFVHLPFCVSCGDNIGEQNQVAT